MKTKYIQLKEEASKRLSAAITELKAQYKTQSPADQKVIRASIASLTSVNKTLKATIEEEMAEEIIEEGLEDLSEDELAGLDADDLLEDDVDDLSDEGLVDDLDLDDEEQALALNTLAMATAMLQAAIEDEDEEASEEDEEADADAEDEEADADADEADADAEDADADAEDADADAEEADADAADLDEDFGDEDMSEDDLGDDEDLGDEDVSIDDEVEGDLGGEDLGEEDEGEVMSEEELAALEAEGLLDAATVMSARLKTVRAAVEGIPSFEEADEADPMPLDYAEDGEEVLTSAEFMAVLQSMTMEDRAATLNASGAAIMAKKMTDADRRKMEKSAKKNRKLRRFRSEWKKSSTGKKGVIMLPGGKKKMVRKKFYFSTYDSKGNFLGTMWFIKNRVNPTTQEAYKKKWGAKHPAALGAKNDKAIAAMKAKKAPKAKKK